MRPLLEIFTISFNESNSIKELINFYRERVPSCLITIQDNMSIDNSEQIAKDNNCKFITFDTNNKMDESTLIQLRNNSWKKSDAIYVIVCDCDELIDVKEEDLLYNLENGDWNIAKCKGVELFGNDKFFKDAMYGVYSDVYSKTSLWLKDVIEEINLSAGSHLSSPTMNYGFEIKYCQNPPTLYHTKWMDWENGLKRQKEIRTKGLSEDSMNKGWNFHYVVDDNKYREFFENGFNKRIKIK